MRRILISLVASAAVLSVAPAASQARSHHHHAHHVRHHRAHHSRVTARHRRFSRRDHGRSGGENNAQQAGTVTGFSNGVLTITLNDGTVVNGTVNGRTQIECISSNQQDDQGNNGDNDGSSSGQGHRDGDQGGGDENGDGGQMCGTASLVLGTPVAQADLRIDSSGATWTDVELITPATTTGDGDNWSTRRSAYVRVGECRHR
jgi:hypothetical protein